MSKNIPGITIVFSLRSSSKKVCFFCVGRKHPRGLVFLVGDIEEGKGERERGRERGRGRDLRDRCSRVVEGHPSSTRYRTC